MGVASLILGILSLVIAVFFNYVGWLGAILGLVGIILGAVARKNSEQKGLGTGGLVCSIIGFVLSIIFYIACIACVAGLGSVL